MSGYQCSIASNGHHGNKPYYLRPIMPQPVPQQSSSLYWWPSDGASFIGWIMGVASDTSRENRNTAMSSSSGAWRSKSNHITSNIKPKHSLIDQIHQKNQLLASLRNCQFTASQVKIGYQRKQFVSDRQVSQPYLQPVRTMHKTTYMVKDIRLTYSHFCDIFSARN